MEKIQEKLERMGYGKRNIGSFSKSEQKKIMKYLQALEGDYLLRYLKMIREGEDFDENPSLLRKD